MKISEFSYCKMCSALSKNLTLQWLESYICMNKFTSIFLIYIEKLNMVNCLSNVELLLKQESQFLKEPHWNLVTCHNFLFSFYQVTDFFSLLHSGLWLNKVLFGTVLYDTSIELSSNNEQLEGSYWYCIKLKHFMGMENWNLLDACRFIFQCFNYYLMFPIYGNFRSLTYVLQCKNKLSYFYK
jgi:hypothetical protein